ncbi:DUF192 domain-containing protein [uncultured Shewanella sp.]|uniref:DUF192 domain-containing protein n=1 Tax=uncultured Shewanella sp. TaxID=173975 RepID=UPI00260DF854|nr:DUF192 domain-containing protein [uncultured Shewanella sp.]
MNNIKVANQQTGSAIANVRLANTAALRMRGLLGSKPLSMQQGLLIIPCNSVHTFGMSYSIDVVYLNKKNQVVKIIEALKPTRISGCLTASKVLEIAAGSAEKNMIRKGDILSW